MIDIKLNTKIKVAIYDTTEKRGMHTGALDFWIGKQCLLSSGTCHVTILYKYYNLLFHHAILYFNIVYQPSKNNTIRFVAKSNMTGATTEQTLLTNPEIQSTLKLTINKLKLLKLTVNKPKQLKLTINKPKLLKLIVNKPKQLKLTVNKPKQLKLIVLVYLW
jgi:hypothetical protein